MKSLSLIKEVCRARTSSGAFFSMPFLRLLTLNVVILDQCLENVLRESSEAIYVAINFLSFIKQQKVLRTASGGMEAVVVILVG